MANSPWGLKESDMTECVCTPSQTGGDVRGGFFRYAMRTGLSFPQTNLRVISMGVSETKHLVNSQNNIFSSLSSQASQTVYPEPSELALSALCGRVPPRSSFFFFCLHFKLTISNTVHCGRRMCNKTKLSGCG